MLSLLLGLAAPIASGERLTAQNRVVLRPQPPADTVGLGAVLDPAQVSASGVDEGPVVMMPISLNIDRHLKKAQDFLEREKYSSAFQVLQAVIEGRTMTDSAVGEGTVAPIGATGADPDAGDAATPKPRRDEPDEDETPAENPPANGDAAFGEVSAAAAVYSEDGRIYRPVRRLCHEMLATLPPQGVAAYRAEFEFVAERELELATESQSVVEIEAVYERFFMTNAAARALELAGDLRMDRAQFRAALVNYGLLLETYPDDERGTAGIDDTMVAVKIALCFAYLGERDRAVETLAELARAAPDRSDRPVRILGELVTLGELPTHPIFAHVHERSSAAPVAAVPNGDSQFDVAGELVPLWEFRFSHDRPYKVVRESDDRSGWRMDGTEIAVQLNPSLAAPGTTVTLVGDRLVFLDHYRLRSHHALSGRMLLETEGQLAEKIAAGQIRARVAASDFLTSEVTTDGTRMFAVVGVPNSPEVLGQIVDNQIVAVRPDDLGQLWSTEDQDETASVTYLANPTVFGSRLLVPVFENGTISLACLEAATGAPVYEVAIHRGGTDLLRPLASPVVVEQGTAYVLTNAGGLAAIDVHTATLRWIRRYERVHPLRPDKLAATERSGNVFGMAANIEISKFPGFAPSRLLLFENSLVFAPCDGNVLMSIDAATGEPLWMLNRRSFVPEIASDSRWTYLIGTYGPFLLVGGEHDVTCVDMRTGVRRWRDELPSTAAIGSWRGRGTVTPSGDLLMPGLREIFVRSLAADDEGRASTWRRVPLPALSIGRDPLEGEFNVKVDGMYLTAAYEGGIEIYSSVATLLSNAARADDPERVALLQAQAGELSAAFDTLAAVDLTTLESSERSDLAQRALGLAAELAAAMAAHGARADALAMLDRVRTLLDETRDIKRWHLTRIEIFEALGDAAEVESEQRALYALMERS